MPSSLIPAHASVLDYGIDGPGVRRGMFAAGIGGLALAALGAIAAVRVSGFFAIFAWGIVAIAALAAIYGFGMAGYMTHSSRVGKLRTRETLLDRSGEIAPWTGRETVLDVGCGRGLLMIGAARRLTGGRAIGIDLWRQEDQSGNRAEATLENARLEGVEDRVSVVTGDMCALPFGDASFDVVLSHWVVHNLSGADDRALALDEMLRVLRPGGTLVLADISHLAEYREHLASRGLDGVRVETGGIESRILGILSGGSFRPQSLVGRRV